MLDYMDHMLRFRKQYHRALEPCCKKWHLTQNELDVLLFLCNNPTLDRASDIVSRRGIAKSHVSQSVAALEARGLLCKLPDLHDRRTVHLHLQPAARELTEEITAAQRQFFRLLGQDLTPEDMENWSKIIQKLLAAIRRMEKSN